MAKKVLTDEEKRATYKVEMDKITTKRDKQYQKLEDKKTRLIAKIQKKYADDPEKIEQEIGILEVDNGVWHDLYEEQFVDRAKTLEIKYLKGEE